jgi:dihydroneopterin triphosphate diphosphatase
MPTRPYKIPRSTLVLVYTHALEVLLIERADSPGFWQSVTGSQDAGETLRETAARELFEETGIRAGAGDLINWRQRNVFSIYPQFLHRYPPGTTHNTEHVFALEVPAPVAVTLAPAEHTGSVWLPWPIAAEKVRSWSNRRVILDLPTRCRG